MPEQFVVLEKIKKEELHIDQKDSKITVKIDDFFKRILPTLPNLEFTFTYTFTFKYDNRIYKVSDKHLLNKIDEYYNNEDDYTHAIRYILTIPTES